MKSTKCKRILALILTLTLMLTAIPLTALPAAAATSGDFEYEVISETDKTCKITKYNGSAAELEIPSQLDGYTVTEIDGYYGYYNGIDYYYGAFDDCTSLASITIPNSVTYIGGSAFRGCTSLSSVTIPDSVTMIGDDAFSNTAYYKNGANWENEVLYIGNHLIDAGVSGSYEIKEGTKTIAGGAFEWCTLTSITIPDSVTSIGSSAFSYCRNLTSITIPNSVTYIGGSVFRDCTALTSVALGNGITSIGYCAFEGCTSLTSITIPDSVTSIGDYVFEDCTSLTSITIPDSVTSIGEYPFRGCTSLADITISDNITDIGYWDFEDTAFYNNDANWKNGVLYIGNHLIKAKEDISGGYQIKQGTKTIAGTAFEDCISLTNVTISDSVTRIGYRAFSDCIALTAINVPANNTAYSSIDGVLFNKDKTELICYPAGKTAEAYTIPSGVTSIGSNAFSHCTSLTSVTIPDSVTSIGDRAFSNTAYYNNEANWENGVLYIGNHLIEADYDISGDYQIKQGTKTIADDAFYDCTSLTSVTIPDSVTHIGNYAFFDSGIGNSITIPSSVIYIGEYAFGYYFYMWDKYEKYYDFTISGCKGTAAEQYANDNGFTFIELQGGDTVLPGDVNGDGKVSAVDARWALQCAAKKRTLDEKQTKAADMNGDGKITAVDARQILKKAAGKA